VRLQAQEYLVKLPDRIRKLSERAAARKAKTKALNPTAKFSWVFNREVALM
jgi:acyl-[acyl-carrier-protein] desaturase